MSIQNTEDTLFHVVLLSVWIIGRAVVFHRECNISELGPHSG
jgi:hypothetical protein